MPATIDDSLPDALGGRRYDRVDPDTGQHLGHAWQGQPVFVVRGPHPHLILAAVTAATARIRHVDRAGRENGEPDDLDPWTWHPDYVSPPALTPDGATFTVDLAGEYTGEQVMAMARILTEELDRRETSGQVTGPAAAP